MVQGKDLRDAISQLLSLPIEEMAVRPSLGDVNFSAVLPAINGIFAILKPLENFGFEALPEAAANKILGDLQRLLNELLQMRSFNLNIPNPTEQRNNIQREISARLNEVFARISPVVGVMLLISDRTQATEKERQTEELLDRLKKAETDAQEGLKSIQTAAAQAGVAKEAVYFSEQANEQKSNASFWGRATAILTTAIIIWGIIAAYLVSSVGSDPKLSEVVGLSLSKIIILSGLYYALVWCARNYRASQHNYVVNKHRQISLSTFEAFVQAAGDDLAVKNAVLLQATTSIFTSQPSGYTQSDPEPDQPNKIIEITRSLTGKG